MQVFLNEDQVLEVAADGLRLGELIDGLRVQLDPDEVLTALRIGNDTFAADEVELWQSRPLLAGETLHLETRSGCGIAEELEDDVADALAVVHWKLARAADLLAVANSQQEAFGLLAQSVEELQLAMVLDRQVDTLRAGRGRTEPERVESVAQALVDAQVARDASRVGTLLREQLVPIVGEWATRAGRSPEANA